MHECEWVDGGVKGEQAHWNLLFAKLMSPAIAFNYAESEQKQACKSCHTSTCTLGWLASRLFSLRPSHNHMVTLLSTSDCPVCWQGGSIYFAHSSITPAPGTNRSVHRHYRSGPVDAWLIILYKIMHSTICNWDRLLTFLNVDALNILSSDQCDHHISLSWPFKVDQPPVATRLHARTPTFVRVRVS